MKMKKIFGVVLSTALAFGLAFGALPAKVAEAAPVTDYVDVDGNYIVNGTNIFILSSITAGDMEVNGTTITFTGLNAGDIIVNYPGYTFVFSGTNILHGENGNGLGFDANETATIELMDGATLTADHFNLMQHGPVTQAPDVVTVTLASGVTATYASKSTPASDVSGTLSGVITAETSYDVYNTVVFSKGGSNSSGNSGTNTDSSTNNSSGTNTDSGSTSSGGSGIPLSAEQATAIAYAATNSASATTAVPVTTEKATPDMSANSSIDKATVKTSANGTAKISNIESEATEVEVDSTVEVDGASYKVKTLGKGALKNCDNVETLSLPKTINKIEKGALKGADNLKTIKIKITKSITVQKGAFNGTDSSKMTIKVSKKMSSSEFKKLKNTLNKAGYKGKVKRSL